MEMQVDYPDKLGQMRTLFGRRGGCQEAPILIADIYHFLDQNAPSIRMRPRSECALD